MTTIVLSPPGDEDEHDDDEYEHDGYDDADEEGGVVGVGLDALGPVGLGVLLPRGVGPDLEPVHRPWLERAVAVAGLAAAAGAARSRARLALPGANGEVLDGGVVERVVGVRDLVGGPGAELLHVLPLGEVLLVVRRLAVVLSNDDLERRKKIVKYINFAKKNIIIRPTIYLKICNFLTE